jgi:hypothetical protein
VPHKASAMPWSGFHGFGSWQGMPIVLARVLHQTAGGFYGREIALRGVTAGTGREEGLGKENQALKVSYDINSH